MSENVMNLDRPFTAEAFEKLDIRKLTIPELAERIRRGDRDSMLHMYTLLHDDLFAIVNKTITSEHQAEFIIRKSFAEVFHHHEDIDPDVFELSLIQVLSENTQKQNIHNTFSIAFNRNGHVEEKKEDIAKPTVQEVTSPLMSSIKAKAVPAKLSFAVADGAAISDYVEEPAVDLPLQKGKEAEEESLTKTISMPVILSSAAALAAAGVGTYSYQQQQKEQQRQKNLSYTQMMEALDIEFVSNEDGSEVTTLEYQPGILQSVTDFVSSYNGTLNTNTSALDLSKVGSTLVSYSLSQSDEYNQTARTVVSRSYTVVDTQLPIIATNVDSVEITEGDSLDITSVVSSVVDPADGSLTYMETEPEMLMDDALGRIYETGWYTVTSDVDTNTAGSYTISIHAVDNHGNVTDASIPVTVNAKPVVTVSNATVTSTSVSVDTGANAQSIYSLLTGTYGLSKAAASGILANISIESSFNPSAGSSYYGLCQWGGSRLSNLVAFCSANGYSSDSVNGQIAFMISEMGSSMIATMNSFADSSDGAAEAGVYFRQTFERSAGLNNVANIAASFYTSM